MTRKEQIDAEIGKALDALNSLSENLAKEPNQWLAIKDAELAIHEIRKTFDQEQTNGNQN